MLQIQSELFCRRFKQRTDSKHIRRVMRFEIVVAHNSKRGIGIKNGIPWRCGEDMNFFKGLTSTGKNAVIMGANTWRSIGSSPLKGRVNFVISNGTVKQHDGAQVCKSVQECISSVLSISDKIDRAFVIGGESIYKQFLEARVVSVIYANEILTDKTECDKFFCDVPVCFDKELDYTNSTCEVRYTRYSRHLNTEEGQYLQLVEKILREGERRSDRTGTGTLSVFGNSMRFSLRDGRIPLLTTKRVFWRGVVEELLWMLSGSTDANILAETGVHIWDGNASREFMDGLGFTERRVGDIGPAYGFQWRYSGAKYVDCCTDYTGQGVDQIQRCIDMIKDDPSSRRIILSAWNPSDVGNMNLPPCHVMAQFLVSGQELSCMVFQRSVDVGLGLPFNIASYSLLTHMMAKCCGLTAKELVHAAGDTHIYRDHVGPLERQVKRCPLEFPTVALNDAITEIDGFTAEDITLQGYTSYPSVKMPFSA